MLTRRLNRNRVLFRRSHLTGMIGAVPDQLLLTWLASRFRNRLQQVSLLIDLPQVI